MPGKFSEVIFGSCQVDLGVFRHPDETRLPGGEFFLELAQQIDVRIDFTAHRAPFFRTRRCLSVPRSSLWAPLYALACAAPSMRSFFLLRGLREAIIWCTIVLPIVLP